MFIENQLARWFLFTFFVLGFFLFRSLDRKNYSRSGSWQRMGMMISWMFMWTVVLAETIIIVGFTIKLLFTLPVLGLVFISLAMTWVGVWDSVQEFGKFRNRRADERKSTNLLRDYEKTQQKQE